MENAKTNDTGRDGIFRLNGVSYIVPFTLITLLFFLWGFARAILDILNKHLQNELDITITQSALIQVCTYISYFLMALPAGLFINRYGYRRGVVFGLLLFGVGSILFVPSAMAGTFYAFLVCLFIIGCGLAFLETAANPYSTELGSPETATSRLNLSQSFNGMGSLFATFAVGQFFFGGSEVNNVELPYAILGILVLLIAVVFSRVKLPDITAEAGSVPTNGLSNLRKLFGDSRFRLGLAALLAYEVAEISINSYFINFVTGQGWMNDSTASIVLTFALAFFMVGRFGGSWLMRYVRADKMLLVCAFGTVICNALVLIDLGWISMFALVANYIFEAIMFPTIFSMTLAGLGNLTKSASSVLMMTPVGGCGFLLMGIMADAMNPVAPFIIPLVAFLLVLIFALKRVADAKKQIGKTDKNV